MLKYGSEKASKTDREYVLPAVGVKTNILSAGQYGVCRKHLKHGAAGLALSNEG